MQGRLLQQGRGGPLLGAAAVQVGALHPFKGAAPGKAFLAPSNLATLPCHLALPFSQGYGTFRSPDGSVYQGSWQANLKHGIGKKTYANGDFYEGLWRHGKAEGPGR